MSHDIIILLYKLYSALWSEYVNVIILLIFTLLTVRYSYNNNLSSCYYMNKVYLGSNFFKCSIRGIGSFLMLFQLRLDGTCRPNKIWKDSQNLVISFSSFITIYSQYQGRNRNDWIPLRTKKQNKTKTKNNFIISSIPVNTFKQVASIRKDLCISEY